MRTWRISRQVAENVANAPDQIVPVHSGRSAYQSRVRRDGEDYLLRIIIDDSDEPARAITMYLTSKIGKYWRPQQ